MMSGVGGGGNWMGHSRQGDIDETGQKLYDSSVVTRLAAYMLPFKSVVTLAVFGVILYTAATVAIPAIIGFAIDNAIRDLDSSALNIIAVAFAGVLVLHFGSNWGHQLALAQVSQKVIYNLRMELFIHLQRLPMSFHNRNKVGSVMSRAQNDVYQLQEFLDIVVTSLGDLLSLVGIITIMFVLNWRLALVSLASLPILFVIIFVWQRYARPAFFKVRVAISTVNGSLAENLSGVRIVQSMNRQDTNLVNFDKLNKNHLNANLTAAKLSATLMPTVEVFMSFGLAGVIVIGGMQVIDGTVDPGVVIAFSLWIQRFFDPIRSMTQQFTQLQRAMASGSRIFDLLDVEPDLTDFPDAIELPKIKGAVRYDNVSFAYNEGKPVLENINLDVAEGTTVAIVGRTGAGKTTMAALLSRFFDVDDGSLTIDGHDLRGVTRHSLATQMGIVLQEPFQFSATVRENIRYNHPEATEEDIVRAAKAVGIHDHIASLPEGYDTMMEERGGNMSLGQRQLVSFARALVADPRIIILDEATANVDTQTEQLIQQAIGTLLAGRTAVVIAHRLSTIRNADNIVVMEKGHIAEMGTHDELIALGGMYAKQYELHQVLAASGVQREDAPSNEFDDDVVDEDVETLDTAPQSN
ncbi:MAG: ABC transporter ATP-binding protein [Chloroflexi bacterium]|nr:ABC transporter ATP-binding protein [Chloroflexota bacterium]